MKRRDFIKSSAALIASARPALGKELGVNDRIRVGLVGLGGRGLYELSVCQNNPGCEIVAVADVYRPLVDQALGRLGGKATGYSDFRRILDRKDVDAVFVSTPDHWHAIVTIMACQSGKDVYCEKPLSHTLQEGRRMVEAARKYNRVVQTGSQQRSAPHFQKIVEMVQSGRIGKVTMVECWNSNNDAPEGIGNPPDSDPPAGLDWDMYLGPAPKVPYNRNRFIWCYRWFWDYSGGMMTDWGAHHMDVIHWAMGVDAPKAATAVGGKFYLKDNRQTPDTLMTEFEYPGFVARYTVRNCNSLPLQGRSYGVMFYGSLGTLVVDRSSYAVLPEMRQEIYHPDADQVDKLLTGWGGVPPGSGIIPSKPVREAAGALKPLCSSEEETEISIDPSSQIAHVQNFFDCIRSRQKPVADVEIGHRSITACQLGVIAYKVGRQLHWDAQQERIIGDDEAQKLALKPYRTPWLLPTL
jgi:predicted dehydrogenase